MTKLIKLKDIFHNLSINVDLNSKRREVCNTWCDVGKWFEFFMAVSWVNSRCVLLINSNHKLMSWKFRKRKLLIKNKEGDGEARGTILSATFHPSVWSLCVILGWKSSLSHRFQLLLLYRRQTLLLFIYSSTCVEIVCKFNWFFSTFLYFVLLVVKLHDVNYKLLTIFHCWTFISRAIGFVKLMGDFYRTFNTFWW